MTIDEILEQHEGETLDELRQQVMMGKLRDLEPMVEAELPVTFRDLQDQIIEGMAFAEELNSKIEAMKQSLYEAMEANGVKRWQSDKMTVTYVEPSVRFSFDSRRFKAEQPEVFNQFQKRTETKGSVRITIKKQES